MVLEIDNLVMAVKKFSINDESICELFEINVLQKHYDELIGLSCLELHESYEFFEAIHKTAQSYIPLGKRLMKAEVFIKPNVNFIFYFAKDRYENILSLVIKKTNEKDGIILIYQGDRNHLSKNFLNYLLPSLNQAICSTNKNSNLIYQSTEKIAIEFWETDLCCLIRLLDSIDQLSPDEKIYLKTYIKKVIDEVIIGKISVDMNDLKVSICKSSEFNEDLECIDKIINFLNKRNQLEFLMDQKNRINRILNF